MVEPDEPSQIVGDTTIGGGSQIPVILLSTLRYPDVQRQLIIL